MDAFLKFTQQAAFAQNIKSLRYESLTPEQRAHLEQSLGYFDYFTGYDDGDDEAAKARKLNAAIDAFVADNKLENLNPLQQFLAMLLSFLDANGVDTSVLSGVLPKEVTDSEPANHWRRGADPKSGQPIAIPATVETGALGATLTPPAAEGTDKNGRYRLMTVATDGHGRETSTEMVVLDPAGKVVWRGKMNSGAANCDSLPGLRTVFDGRPITTEYKIDWNDVRLDRRDKAGLRGMSYSDGSPGFSFTLENPANIAALGGGGRGDFRIHPGGRDVGTAGCLEFLDHNGGLSKESDRQAYSFMALMTSLPPSQRPVSLEVLNARMLGQHVEVAPPRAAAGSKPAPDIAAIAPANIQVALPPEHHAAVAAVKTQMEQHNIQVQPHSALQAALDTTQHLASAVGDRLKQLMQI